MKLVKRGLIFLALMLFLISSVYAQTNLTINLTGTKIGPGSNFDGFITLNFTDYKPFNSLVNFNIENNFVYNISIGELINLSGIPSNSLNIISESYINSTNTQEASENLYFINNNSNLAGIDLRSFTKQLDPSEVVVKNLSFQINPNGNINDLSIYIGNKKVYRYQGTPKGWADISTPYLSGSGDLQQIVGGNFYCQNITLPDSGQYNITATVKRNQGIDPNINLNATINEDEPINSLPSCDSDQPCCTMQGISDQLSDASCVINKKIYEKKDVFVCVYPNDNDPNKEDFSIKTSSTAPINGFVSGNPNFYNFYIFGKYRTYDTLLSRATQINIDPDSVNSYIQGDSGCTINCLLIPLKFIITSGNGSLNINNLNMPYIAQAIVLGKTQFRKINLIPPSFSYNNLIKINLNKLYDLVSPIVLGKKTIFFDFDNINSNKIDFDVVNAPKPFIRYKPFNPGINDEITFEGNYSVSVQDRNITDYIWDFGDNITGNGAFVKHSYLLPGDYTVALKVIDSEGVYAIDKLNITVQNASSIDINQLINKTSSAIISFKNNLDTSPNEVKDTANLLGILQKINNFEINLTKIKNSFNSSENLTAEQTNYIISEINQINKEIPLKFSVDSSATFNGKISSLNQIISCCEFTTDLQRNKLLAAQKDIKINAEARIVSINYPNNNENFMLIKKDIIGNGLKVYEFVPFGLTISPENIIAGGQLSAATVNVYSFSPTTQLVYKVDTTDLNKALETRTAVLPFNLDNISVSLIKDKTQITSQASVCGNKICENDEDTNNCPQDCKSFDNSWMILIGVFIILIVLFVYFGYFFKGGLLKKKKFDTRKLFKTDRDYESVKHYVESSFKNNSDEGKIKDSLKLKGWKDYQINSVVNEVKNSSKKTKR